MPEENGTPAGVDHQAGLEALTAASLEGEGAATPPEGTTPEGNTQVLDQGAPAIPAVPGAPVTTPTPEGTTPVVAGATPEGVDPFADMGGQPYVQDAVAVFESMRSREGAQSIAAQLLVNLGYAPEQVKALLSGEQSSAPAPAAAAAAPAAVADPFASIPDDASLEDMTGAQLKALLVQTAQQAAQAATAAVQGEVKPQLDAQREAFEAQRQTTARQTTDITLVQLLGDQTAADPAATVDKSFAAMVLEHASKYIADDDWDPVHIRQAIVRGHTDATQLMDRAQQAYLLRKEADRLTQPTSVAGLGNGGETVTQPKEPKNSREASAMGRAMLEAATRGGE